MSEFRPLRGLFVGPEDIERIRANCRDARLAETWRRLAHVDVNAALAAAATHDRGGQRDLAGTIGDLAFTFAISGEAEHGESLCRLLDAVAADPPSLPLRAGDRPMGDLRTAHLALAVAVALDVCGQALADERRQACDDLLADTLVGPSAVMLEGMLDPENRHDWRPAPGLAGQDYVHLDLANWPRILGTCNWLTVMACGVLAGGLVLANAPQAARWRRLGIAGTRRTMGLYAPDGSYAEGGTYWAMTTRHLLRNLEMLRRCARLDLYDDDRLRRTSRFCAALYMPHTGDDGNRVFANIGDSGWRPEAAILMRLASEYRDDLAQWLAFHPPGRQDAWALLWFDPTIAEAPPRDTPRAERFDIGTVACRAGWTPARLFFVLRSGPGANHEHADRNSLLLTACGERLLDDGGGAYNHADPTWPLRTSPHHNTVLIDGRGQRYHDGREGTNAGPAVARIAQYEDRLDDAACPHLLVVSDGTEAYDVPGLLHYQRVLLWRPENDLLVIDRIHARRPLVLTARWQVHNDGAAGSVTVDDNGFVMTRPGVRLHAACAAGAPMSVSAGTQEISGRPRVDHTTSGNEAVLVAHLRVGDSGTRPSVPVIDGAHIRFAGGRLDLGDRIGFTPDPPR